MVISLFMAVFLVGVMYSQRGTGEAILYKEHVQDAADASVYTAASLHARAMNTIALVNQIQMASVATLQAIDLIIFNSGNCSAAADITSPWSDCPALRSDFEGYKAQAEGRLLPLLQSGTRASERIRDGLVDANQAAIEDLVDNYFGPPVQVPVLVSRGLPIQTADNASLCTKGSMYLTNIMQFQIPEPMLNPDVFQTQPPPQVFRGNFLCPNTSGPQIMSPINASGTDSLQVRTVTIGDISRLRLNKRGAGFAYTQMGGGEMPEESASDRIGRARFALAQAEYYSTWTDNNDNMLVNELQVDQPERIPEENVFYMHWQARMRRLRIPAYRPIDSDGDDVLEEEELIVTGSEEQVQEWIDEDFTPRCNAYCLEYCAACTDAVLLDKLLGASIH